MRLAGIRGLIYVPVWPASYRDRDKESGTIDYDSSQL